MTLVPLDRLPPDPAGLALREEARAVVTALERILALPAFVHNVDIAVLARLATDDRVPVRERRRAAEVLAHLRLRMLDSLASLHGVREQTLEALGLTSHPGAATNVTVTQVNAPVRVEIVRDDDWRGGEGPGG